MIADQAANGATTRAFLDLPKLNVRLFALVTPGTQVQVLASDIYFVHYLVSNRSFQGAIDLLVGSDKSELAPEADRVELKGMKSYHSNSKSGLAMGNWKL